jgi:ActR/RegA family two-component response regulator
MAKGLPDQTLVAVDDDAELLREISRSLSHRFLVLSTSDSEQGMEWVRNDLSVRILIVGQVIRSGLGIQVLEGAMQIRPDVRRILITSYDDLSELVQGLHCGTIHRTLGKGSLHGELMSLAAPGTQAPAASPHRR